jgi:Putative redox-active protein (C_GCAxxG_C_C)
MSVVDASFDTYLPLEEHATMPLAGGIEQMGFQCGQIWGAALAAGAQAYRLYGSGAQAETAAVNAAQRLVESFRASYNGINCIEVTELDWRNVKAAQVLGFFLKGGPIRCFSMTAGYARAARSEIDAAFADGHLAAPDPPVSCAAMLARMLGASDMHAVMAAGFAGGIGLSGGACGALGAAIWILSMNSGREGKVEYNSPEAMNAIDRFVESTDVKFDCSEIAGRRFADVGDHAAYLHAGGCSEVIQALAAAPA